MLNSDNNSNTQFFLTMKKLKVYVLHKIIYDNCKLLVTLLLTSASLLAHILKWK